MLKRVLDIIDEQGVSGLIKTGMKRTLPFRNKVRWGICSRQKRYSGITDVKRERKVIVSLTSFPARIDTVYITIKSILMQSLKPDLIILWLAHEQFPQKENELPRNLLELKKYGLAIEWCHDIKSYKKLIPAMRIYPNDIIVTADDDVYYERHWLKRLYMSYLEAPGYVHCHRVTRFYIENGEYKIKLGEFEQYPVPSYLHKLTGVGGVLYPPHSLHGDVLDEDKFTRLAPTNDDIWFWFMAIINGTKVNVVKNNIPRIQAIKSTLDGECLYKINNSGEKLIWKDFYRMLDEYPQAGKAMQDDFFSMQ